MFKSWFKLKEQELKEQEQKIKEHEDKIRECDQQHKITLQKINQLKMNQQEALNILVSAAEIANKRGAFSLKESKDIATAVEQFQPKEEPQQPAQDNINKQEEK